MMSNDTSIGRTDNGPADRPFTVDLIWNEDGTRLWLMIEGIPLANGGVRTRSFELTGGNGRVVWLGDEWYG